MWGLFEAPAATMRRIVIARHKNYVILLSCLFGIALVLGIIWALSLGRQFGGLGPTLAVGVLAGPVAGLLAVVLIGLVVRQVSRLLGGHATMRETLSMVAYAMVPIVISLVLILPIEIAVFGQYLFDNNPPPLVINPPAFIGLVALDVLAVLWAWVLLITGTRVAQRLTRPRAVLSTLAVPALVAIVAEGLRLVR
ncbi:MAG TPA: Yip1 family protein [Bacteroidota bacterium]